MGAAVGRAVSLAVACAAGLVAVAVGISVACTEVGWARGVLVGDGTAGLQPLRKKIIRRVRIN
jgi:hypothetical protein